MTQEEWDALCRSHGLMTDRQAEIAMWWLSPWRAIPIAIGLTLIYIWVRGGFDGTGMV